MNVRTRGSAIIGALVLAASLTLTTAAAQESPAAAPPAGAVLTEVANHVPPVHEYDRSGLGCSVTGGFVYRGGAVPELVGQYVFSDYCDGTVRTLRIEDGKVTGEGDLGVEGGEVISFVEGGDGELYVLAIGGTIARIDPA